MEGVLKKIQKNILGASGTVPAPPQSLQQPKSVHAPVLLHHAQALVRRIAVSIASDNGVGSMTPSIYDTAWLSMIPKPGEKGRNEWLFPECFEYLLDQQNEEGGWDLLNQGGQQGSRKYPEHLAIPECIVHSLAALLALLTHFKDDRSVSRDGEKPLSRGLATISKAKRFLDQKLKVLQLEGITHLGFELLVPTVLNLLEDNGLRFEFPAKEELMAMYKEASSVNLELLYENNGPCRLCFFPLEAFLDHIDLERLGNLVGPAGICASPASTAVFLIYSPTWNTQCEEYLRDAVHKGPGRGNGSVGSVFPLEIFEASWVLSALLDNGFSMDELAKRDVDIIFRVLEREVEDGVVGATSTFYPDADNTSRAITLVNIPGYKVSPVAMIRRFEGDECFKTFDDRVPNSLTSMSANANVLNCLVHSPDPDAFSAQIEKVAKFLCERSSEGKKLVDHWNTSEFYTIMTITQSLCALSPRNGQSSVFAISFELIFETIPICLQKLQAYILRNQKPNGSWGSMDSTEETAYAVLALSQLYPHVQLLGLQERLDTVLAISRGKQFILDRWVPGCPIPDCMWTGKVLQGFSYVGEAYVLAALKTMPW
ncbi:terpene synthase family protein [Aspergillus undulatus]|uniref:terpene synthase family protein n=1 Tax=Aspergillus undulatus TaxID=1810928 RepID=UPI003CCE0995